MEREEFLHIMNLIRNDLIKVQGFMDDFMVASKRITSPENRFCYHEELDNVEEVQCDVEVGFVSPSCDIEQQQSLNNDYMAGAENTIGMDCDFTDESFSDLLEHEDESVTTLDNNIEDELCGVNSDFDTSSCDEFNLLLSCKQHQLFIEDESLIQLNKEAATPYMVESGCIIDVEVSNKSYAMTTLKHGLSSVLGTETYDLDEELQEVKSWSFHVFDPGVSSTIDGVMSQVVAFTCVDQLPKLLVQGNALNAHKVNYVARVTTSTLMQFLKKNVLVDGNDPKLRNTLLRDTPQGNYVEWMHTFAVKKKKAQMDGNLLLYLVDWMCDYQRGVISLDEFNLVAASKHLEVIDIGQFQLISFSGKTTDDNLAYDPYWTATLASAISIQLRHTLSKSSFSNKGYIMIRGLIRDYDGFNGPGNLHVAFTFMWSLVRNYDGFNGPGFFVSSLLRDYDGFNGPGHTLRTRCFEGEGYVMVLVL